MTRSMLYVPGNREELFDKALASGADAIICDLEDSVAPRAKEIARTTVARWLQSNSGNNVWVRVNNEPTLLEEDAAMVRSLVEQGVSIAGVVVPKADLAACSVDFGGSTITALIETAEGVAKIYEIAALPSVTRLALGEADLAADMLMEPGPEAFEMWPVRTRVVVASAGCGLVSPCGPVYTNLADHDGLVASSESLRRHGFSGRSVIHPKQVEPVNRVFTPSAEVLKQAAAVVAAYDEAIAQDRAALVVDGKFVDTAVVRQARALLARAPR